MWVGLKRELSSTFSAGHWLPVVHRAPGRGRRLSLTFDDGPTPETTPAVLSLLERFGAAATFFACGSRIAARPDLAAAVVAAGHAIYAHGYNHLRLDLLNDGEALDELDRTERLLEVHRPTPSPYLVRLPYGSGHRLVRMHRLLRGWRSDCQIAHWSYNPHDFQLAEACTTQTELDARCEDATAAAFARRGLVGSVVLLHENPIGASGGLVPSIAVTFLERLLTAAAREKLKVVGLSPLTPGGLLGRYVRTVAMD